MARVPWFLGAPAFIGAILVAAVVTNYLGADYFKRTRLDEANPLAGVSAPGGAGQPDGSVVFSAEVRDGEPGHRGSGTIKLLRAADGSLTLRFEDFSVTNGPDLFVVLSTAADSYAAEGALNLGGLKATDGNFNYDLPAGTDVTKFRSVIIWCRQFDVTFAVAEIPGAAVANAPTRIASASPTAPTTPAASPSGVGGSGGGNTTPAASPTAAPPTQVPAPTATPVPQSGAQLLAQGMFRDGEPGHRGSGIAKLGRDAQGKPVLVIENFSVTNGPDLHVILGATTDGGGQGLDLGKLKATDGTFSYSIPEGADLASFKSVTIWCASFPTIFAVATLEA